MTFFIEQYHSRKRNNFMTLQDKYDSLQNILRQLGKIVIAYYNGVEGSNPSIGCVFYRKNTVELE